MERRYRRMASISVLTPQCKEQGGESISSVRTPAAAKLIVVLTGEIFDQKVDALSIKWCLKFIKKRAKRLKFALRVKKRFGKKSLFAFVIIK